MFKKIGVGLAALGAAAAGAYALFIRPWHLHWRATDEEVHQAMPGDDEVSQANFQSTRAITIKARPAEVWSWLVQMGYGRAGFYSYAWIERALGLRSLSNAERILPEFQHLSVGDIIPIEPGGSGYLVASLEPNRLLVLAIGESDGGIMGTVMKEAHGASTWVYMLHELDSEHTRLLVRWRARLKLSLKMSPSAMFQMVSIEPGEFVMERKMLLGIKQRAEKGRSKKAAEITSTTTPQVPPASADHVMPSLIHVFTRATRPIRAAARTAIFFLKVLPMLPSRPVDWVTKPPVIEKVRYPTRLGQAEGDLYRPSTGGPHPGIIVCLGVVPFGVDNPQLPHLEEALARAGFAALIYWSPVMRDLRLDPEDIENIALAYHWLLEQPYVDPARSGLIGTCVGGSFALMAAASPLIRDRVAFVGAFAPYSSMWTFAQDIASATRPCGEVREPWQVDQLTRKVFVRSLTSFLEPGEAERLRNAFTDQGGHLDSHDLSADGRALYPLLTALGANDAEIALHRLPPAIQEYLTALSPLSYLRDMHAPLIVFGHDRDDLVIPVGESRRLWSALSGRAGMHYTEFAMFQHVDPTKRKLPLFRFVQQLDKFFLYVYPMFRQAVAS